MRLISIESSFHPCKNLPRLSQGRTQWRLKCAGTDACSVGGSHPSCFASIGVVNCCCVWFSTEVFNQSATVFKISTMK